MVFCPCPENQEPSQPLEQHPLVVGGYASLHGHHLFLASVPGA